MDDKMENIAMLLFRLMAEEKISAEERMQLDEWLAASPYNQQVLQEAGDIATLRARLKAMDDMDEEALWSKTFPARTIPLYRRWWAAAAVLVLLLTGAYFIFRPSSAPNHITAQQIDVQPGRQGAILTLADGHEVVLDSLANGIIAHQNGAQVALQNGQLAYDVQKPAGVVAYNKMTTPKGRQFRIKLPDGTDVWLNAESSIRYPTIFSGKERKVEVSGEAYFEVAADPQMPFHVSINNETDIEVLGTHFNINAYNNEQTQRTTLLQGAVRVRKDNNAVVLKPGQQAMVTESIRVVENADLDKAIAWKNGIFNFRGSTLEEVMRQLARWYNIEVIYEGNISNRKFEGEIGMDLSLQQVLKGLAQMQVNYRIEKGNRIIVMP